ncbi:MAG: hypothetical protein Q8918_01050 [Bacteroidota bacterium]|nr:hypothetical protein [Bacteroidota bacterium]MDP4212619.1 hypothetical protein [Bacteroidota bacterium]MDP4248675.1 hypothetical protein [Bacteroidota bacterium]
MSRNLLQKQIDGIFDTDGMLHFDQSLNQLVYVYFYRNQYIVMDTNLRVQCRGKTLDSNSKAKISVTYIPSDDETTMSMPPFSVNKLSAVDEDYLFIQSALMAVNEDKNAFRNNSAMDVYNLKKQLYEFSFYLPSTANNKMQSFKVSHQKLIALHGPYLEVYQINPGYLTRH